MRTSATDTFTKPNRSSIPSTHSFLRNADRPCATASNSELAVTSAVNLEVPSSTSLPQLRDQFDLNQLCWERKSGRDHKRASHLRCWRPISFFSDGPSSCERLLHICDVQYFLDYILQGGAEFTENLLCVRITLPHLDPHVRVVSDVAAVIERSGTDYIALIIVAQLTGHVDRVINLDGLDVAVLAFPGHSKCLHFPLRYHPERSFSSVVWSFANVSTYARSTRFSRNR